MKVTKYWKQVKWRVSKKNKLIVINLKQKNSEIK